MKITAIIVLSVLVLTSCSRQKETSELRPVLLEGTVSVGEKKIEIVDAVAFYEPSPKWISIKFFPHALSEEDHALAARGQTWGFSNGEPLKESFPFEHYPHFTALLSVERTEGGLNIIPDDQRTICFQDFKRLAHADCETVPDFNPELESNDGITHVSINQAWTVKDYTYEFSVKIPVYETVTN